MNLQSEVSFPSTRSFVLKLHRDVAATGELFGRVENIVSGHHFDFRTGEEMLAFLAAGLLFEMPEQASGPGATVVNQY